MNLEPSVSIQEQQLDVMTNSPMKTSVQCLEVVKKRKLNVRHC